MDWLATVWLASAFLLHPAPPEADGSTFGVGYLGVMLQETDGNGVSVSQVVDGSPASRSPIRPNDLILSIDSRPVKDTTQSRAIIQSLRPGFDYPVVLRRGAETIRVTIRPTTRQGMDP